MSDTHQLLVERLRSLVQTRHMNGGIVSTTAITNTLLDEFPDCGIPPTELEHMVASEAAKSGVAIAFDGRR